MNLRIERIEVGLIHFEIVLLNVRAFVRIILHDIMISNFTHFDTYHVVQCLSTNFILSRATLLGKVLPTAAYSTYLKLLLLLNKKNTGSRTEGRGKKNGIPVEKDASLHSGDKLDVSSPRSCTQDNSKNLAADTF